MELNAAQRDVVYDVTDPILLRAPAGTGKTSVLAQRVAHILAAGLATGPEILCLTFTNRACKELKTRIFSEAKDNGFCGGAYDSQLLLQPGTGRSQGE